MAVLWVAFILASSGWNTVQGLPINPSSRIYPQDSSGSSVLERWMAEGGLYAAIPALVLLCAAFGLLFGCTWCFRHKDCKIFTASATHLHDARRCQPPDSGFSEPASGDVGEDNNNGPISLREMQNIANNNAAAYIASEHEGRDRASRESVVEFEPLPAAIGVVDPLERCTDWFAGEDLPRNRLQYLREIGRGWFGRVVKGEIEDNDGMTTVAVKILNQNASLEDKARFLDEARLYRDLTHEHVLPFIDKCLQEDPWMLIFELCSMDLQQYMCLKRPEMEKLHETGLPLQLMSDVTSALAYLHSRGYLYRNLWSGNILVRAGDAPRAVLGQYVHREPGYEHRAPECATHQPHYSTSSDVWSLGHVVWELCAWRQPPAPRPPPPETPCPYKNHLYQVMQLCWNTNYEARPTAAQVHALINHLHTTYANTNGASNGDGFGSSHFEERWQRLKPNTIPKIDEHVAIVHAPSTSMTSHFTGSDQEYDNAQTIQDSLSVEMGTAVSRSSSVMSDKDTLSVQVKSDSLTNLHGSLEDVRNIYLTHNEMATLECHQGNIAFEDNKERENDRSDSSVDPWLKDIITDSQDDVSYFKDVSDVIKNLDNILNSEKTSSSESSHQASPSRDNLSLECKKANPMQTSMVKSPGISNFKNILDTDLDSTSDNIEDCIDDLGDGDTIGTLSHSFERHSDTISQQTLENITPDTPIKDLDFSNRLSEKENSEDEQNDNVDNKTELSSSKEYDEHKPISLDISNNSMPKLMDLCEMSMSSIIKPVEDVIAIEDCEKSTYDNNDLINHSIDKPEAKSIDNNIVIRTEIDKISLSGCSKINNKNIAILGKEEQEISSSLIDLTAVDESKVIVNSIDEQSNNNKDANDKIKVLDNSPKLIRNVSPEEKSECETENNGLHLVESNMSSKSAEQNLISDLIRTNEEVNASSKEIKISPNSHNLIPNSMDKTDKETSILAELALSSSLDRLNSDKNMGDDISFNTQNNIIALNCSSTFEIIEPKQIEESLECGNENDMHSILSFSPVHNLTPAPNLEETYRHSIDPQQHCNEEGHSIPKADSSDKTYTHNNIVVNETFKIDEIKDPVYYSCSSELSLAELPETVQIALYSESLKSYHLDTNKENRRENHSPTPNRSIKPVMKVQSNNNDVSQVTLHINATDRLSERPKNIDAINKSTDEPSCDSTIYLDLSNCKIVEQKPLSSIAVTNDPDKYLEVSSAPIEVDSSSINESTIYLDLPTVIRETHKFLNAEKFFSVPPVEFLDNIQTSTPKGSENSCDSTLEQETKILSQTKEPVEIAAAATFVKSKNEYGNMSPYESPTKSHHTDTYDENSSVLLGSLENCTFESLKTIKCNADLVDLPKEELLAFSSNFSEINLETPSPLRDGNFLNEVPDIHSDELQLHFEEIVNARESTKFFENVTENTSESDEMSSTEKHVSPSTPPNSPGSCLASTSQMNYLVDIDINAAAVTIDEVVHLNEIELQMTTKLAMAENENNMNIEYSGPMIDEPEDVNVERGENITESYLAGNGGADEYTTEALTIDEERMQELRNELELKLPLAQVSGIEPAEWCPPPPPEVVLAYGALSPIAEETRMQLSAYDNDDHWNYSIRTESSESYPEPCNNSTDEVTDLPTGLQSGLLQSREHSTYTLPSKETSINHTYTVPKEVPSSSKDISMSVDSLNASPLRLKGEALSPMDDKTYTKTEDDKESNCERLSQISPFLLSPTTDTSAPDNSELAAGVSTVSRATVPTDAKSSKPSETQCLSKATSIDSWCSNDTLYNVEENFDDLAMDPDDYEPEIDVDKSESEDTLTHNDAEKEHSHCSTYIVHDSKSDACDTFAPDSITANDHYTYTKAKTEPAATTSSLITKSDFNDSKNTQTKDLAYGTLMSGIPSYSNCTTELVSGMDDTWRYPQPELVRRSPMSREVNCTPPRMLEDHNATIDSPHFKPQPVLKKVDSVEITCLGDNAIDDKFESPECRIPIELVSDEMDESSNMHFRNMAHSVTSTPILEPVPGQGDDDDSDSILINMPENNSDMSYSQVPNFNVFLQSAEIRPQDISPKPTNENTSEVSLEAESEARCGDSSEKPPSYSEFESSAVGKPQELSSKEQSSHSGESCENSEGFTRFENAAKNRPQDMSSLIDASSLLLKSERRSGELFFSGPTNVDSDLKNESESRSLNADPESLAHVNPNNYTKYHNEERHNANVAHAVYITDIDNKDENEQPHSIIITEESLMASNQTLYRSFDSNIRTNHENISGDTFDSHVMKHNLSTTNDSRSEKINENTDVSNTDIVQNEISHPSNSNIKLSEEEEEKEALDKVSGVVDANDKVVESIDTVAPIDNICGTNAVYATISTISETFEELVESNVDENVDNRDDDTATVETNRDEPTNSERSTEVVADCPESLASLTDNTICETSNEFHADNLKQANDAIGEPASTVTEDFLQNEKKFCDMDSYLPLLSDIRFTGPATEIMSTSFTQDSPTEPTSPEREQDSKQNPCADMVKEWDSDTDSHSTNSSSGEFIWKGGDGRETALVPSTHFDHQRDSGSLPSRADDAPGEDDQSSGSADSGSEGDEVDFVPSSWDCRAAPSKSSLRSMEQPSLTQDSKKRVVFKRQKYHCVYEYPREAIELDVDSPAYLPDFSTYSDWDASSAEEAEIGYGQLFGAPPPLNLFPLRSGIAFGADYDEDFFISSSARPFESLGVMSTSSQFFPGMHVKAILERDYPDVPDEFPAPVSLLPTPTLLHSKTPSLDFTTPDSGVEDITPGSLAEDDYKTKKLPEECWRSVDSTSSSESVSPSSPGGSLGGLRHTRGRLKLDLPPSPVAPSPKHNRMFSFVLDKPKRPERDAAVALAMADETPLRTGEAATMPEDTTAVTDATPLVVAGDAPAAMGEDTPLVMTDDTPLITTALVLPRARDHLMPEPTFSTFGKPQFKQQCQDTEKIVLTDDNTAIEEVKEGSKTVEPVKGEGTVLDSGDEDSGIESSSKATLERNTPNVS